MSRTSAVVGDRLIGLILVAEFAAPAIAGLQLVTDAFKRAGDRPPGDADFTLDWDGAIWRFASAANWDAFRSGP